jgi:hypothetical protein
MRHLQLSVLAGLFIVALMSACTSLPLVPTATVDYDHNYDFSGVHKFSIQPIPRDTVATLMVSDEQISRINQALTTELTLRGFEVVSENADADMFLSWQFIPKESLEVATYDPAKQRITEATLYVNLIDPLLLQSKWRATFRADLSDQPETPQAARYRQDAAKAILAQFPPDPNAS